MSQLPPPPPDYGSSPLSPTAIAYESTGDRGRSAWALTLGIISTIFGAFGLLSVIIGVIGLIVTASRSGSVSPTTDIAIPHLAIGPQIVLQSISLVMSSLLLWAGISFLKNRPNGRKLHLIWATLEFPVVILTSVLNYPVIKELTKLQAHGGNSPLQSDGVVLLLLALGACAALIYPTTLLILLNLRSAKESIARAVKPV